MVKRRFGGENHAVDDAVEVQEPKRRLPPPEIEMMKGVWMQELFSRLEPLLRRVVREELERMSQSGLPLIPRASIHQIGPSVSRRWQLHFINKFKRTLFTSNKIEAANGEPVQIVMLDAISKRIVDTGPLSSVKIEISVLDGDFGTDENESWSKEEFASSVIVQRKGKRPLVAGDLHITLVDGIGYLGEAIFTDNSSWTRSRKFRLGARVVGERCTYEEIREARSEAFMVKDHRGELYKKHYPPFLCDEVWRLEKIGKDGAFHNRLASHQVNNVRDFLRILVTDPSSLRSKLGSGMSSKIWDTVVQHAMTCNMDNKRYVYRNSEQQFGLVFDSVYRLVGITFDNKCVNSLENLTLNQSQMNTIENLRHRAYRNLDQITEIEYPMVDSASVIPPLEGYSVMGAVLDPQPPMFQGQPAHQANIYNPPNALPRGSQEPAQLEDFSVEPSCYPVHLYSTTQMNSLEMPSPSTPLVNDSSQWDPVESSDSIATDGYLTGDDTTHFKSPNWFLATPPWGQGAGVFMTLGDETDMDLCPNLAFSDISFQMMGNSSSKMKWTKVIAAIKWVRVTMNAAAARRAGSSN